MWMPASCPRIARDSPVSASHLTRGAPGLQMYVPGFCIHSGDPNTGPHTWAASTLPLEPFLPPHPHSFLWDGINTVKERKSRSPVPDSEIYAGTWRVTQLFKL